ncbi:MAG: hydroxypyruvate isomerase [Methylococcales bacterium]|nr:hydroxypyruvate isomerase [Methylococcales bacterium]
MPKFAANLSLLFTEVDFEERFERAARAGFQAVEYLFPYAFDKQRLAGLLKEHDLQQVLHNMPPGNWAAGERGIAILPERTDEFRASVDMTIEYATVLGCPHVNCLAGVKPEGVEDAVLRDTFIGNLRYAAERLAASGIKLLVESINPKDIPGFYLNTSAQAMAIIDAVGHDNHYFQYDLYHMQIVEGDLARTMKRLLPRIAHMQLADVPGRHEPGSGEINYAFLFAYLDRIGYEGWIGCEYHPLGLTEEGLLWMSYLVWCNTQILHSDPLTSGSAAMPGLPAVG